MGCITIMIPEKNSESGATLVLVLLVLVALTLLALSGWYLTKTSVDIAGNIAYRNAALNISNVALEDAGNYINTIPMPPGLPSVQPSWFYNSSAPTASPISAITASSPQWSTAKTVSIPSALSNSLQGGSLQYFMEFLGDHACNAAGYVTNSTCYYYRVTVMATGARDTHVITQSTYRLVTAKQG